MTDQRKEYQLLGCFSGQRKQDSGLLLGRNYTQPRTSRVSLSACLKACVTIPTSANILYPYIGVAGGDSCYCGEHFDPSTATQVDSNRCTTPCQDNATEACGGTNAMSVYRLATAADDLAMRTLNTNIDTVAVVAEDTGNESNPPTNDPTSPGAAAGIAMGSIMGVCVLVATIFLYGRWRKRKIPQSHSRSMEPDRQYQFSLQRQPSRRETVGNMMSLFSGTTESSAEAWTTTSTTPSLVNVGHAQGERITICDATMVDLKRLSGIVVDAADGRSEPRRGVYALRDSRGSSNKTPLSYIDGNIRQIDVSAATSTTGLQWRHTQNLPLTPRTPRTPRDRSDSEGGFSELEDGSPISPRKAVREPELTAQNNGLGERAWHRRRLSMPYLPDGGESERSLNGAYAGSGHHPSGRSSPNWRPATATAVSNISTPRGAKAERRVVVDPPIVEGNLSDGPPTPRPLRVDTVVTRMYDEEEDEDEPALSPSWVWTVQGISDDGGDKMAKVD